MTRLLIRGSFGALAVISRPGQPTFDACGSNGCADCRHSFYRTVGIQTYRIFSDEDPTDVPL